MNKGSASAWLLLNDDFLVYLLNPAA